jgi:hypothetical protein
MLPHGTGRLKAADAVSPIAFTHSRVRSACHHVIVAETPWKPLHWFAWVGDRAIVPGEREEGQSFRKGGSVSV